MMSDLPSSSADQSADINVWMHECLDQDQIINKLIQAKLILDTNQAQHISSESTSHRPQEIEMSNKPVKKSETKDNSPNLSYQTDRRHLSSEIYSEVTMIL